MRRKLVRTALVIGVVVATLGLLPAAASAATQSVTPTFSGSGNPTDIVSLIAVCDLCVPDVYPSGYSTAGLGVQATAQAQASWSNPSTIDMAYTAGNLRRGQTLDLTDTLTPGAGNITVDYSVSATLGVYGTNQTGSDVSCADAAVSGAACNGWVATSDTTTVGPVTGSDTIPCTLPLPGESPRDCTKTKTIQLWNTDFLSLASVEVDLILDESVTVTSSGVQSVRIAVISGGPSIANKPLTFVGSSPSTVSDPIAISCAQPVGNDLMYSLTNNGSTVDPATYSGDVKVKLQASVLGIPISYTTPPLVGTSGADLGPINLAAPDQQVDLGPVLPNNVPPTTDAGGPYSGVEGTPITFDATGSTSICGLSNLTFVWHFSDGGVAYGATPQHTFLSPGTFSGLLTATDSDGNVASQAFSVTVANLPPVTHAGPDMSTEWGVPIELQGSAVDPGTDEQPFLTYSWNFGDGSPSASGGATVAHTYALPGTYTATFTACDPENACSSDTTQVVVSKRATITTYTGPNQSLPSHHITLSASVVDDLGQPVAGRTVVFTIGSQTISATTDSSGVASASLKLKQKHGTHPVSAVFSPPSSDKYTGSSDTESFLIGP